jgi:hypothetical protein
VTRADRLRREVAALGGIFVMAPSGPARAAIRERLDAKIAELHAAEDADRADADDDATRAADLAEDADAELEVAK